MRDWNEKLDITAENFGSVVWLWLWGSDSSFNILLYTVDLPWEIICNSDLVEIFLKPSILQSYDTLTYLFLKFWFFCNIGFFYFIYFL